MADQRLLLTVLFPVTFSILASFFEPFRVWAALYGIAISIIDVSLIEKKLLEWKTESAKIQERFDCNILELAWNEIKVGGRPEREKISEAAELYGPERDNKFKDWYPRILGLLPQHLARLVCLRESNWWPTEVRRRYLSWLWVAFIALIALAVVAGVAARVSMDAFILAVVAPISPTLLWFVRELRKQTETTTKLGKLLETIEDIWDKTLKRAPTEEQQAEKARQLQDETKARQLQDETYDFRCSYQPIYRPVYRRLRKGLSERMDAIVLDMVKEALSALNPGSDEAQIEEIIREYMELPSKPKTTTLPHESGVIKGDA